MARSSRILGVTLALVGSTALQARAEDVTLDKVPDRPRAVIMKHVGNGKIADIDRETKYNKIFYDVEWRDAKGVKYEMVVGEDGIVIQPPSKEE